MCGRARCALAPEQITSHAGTSTWEGRDLYRPSHNASPGTHLPVIHLDKAGQPIIQSMRWGLVPSFTKPTDRPDFWRMFNARSESISEKPSFRRLVPTKRCVILVNGFYEWKKEGSAGKQPYYIYLKSARGDDKEEEKFMPLAGLWDTWHGPDDEILHTFTILTTDSCPKLEWLHDRMPVILKDEAAERLWLDTTDRSALGRLQSILDPYDGKDLTWHSVTKSMSNPSFQDEEAYKEIKKPSLQSFFQPKVSSKASPSPIKTAKVFPKEDERKAPAPAQAAVAAVKEKQAEQQVRVEAEGAAVDRLKEEDEGGHTPNTDEEPPGGTSAAAGEVVPAMASGEEQPGTGQEKEKEGHNATSGKKRKVPATSPSSKKKARPPGQPDIASFFTNKKK